MRYYVYQHVHPETKEVVYVGHGTGGRAWSCGHKGLPIRSERHRKWLDGLLNTGKHPGEFVEIVASSLSKDDAKRVENELIYAIRPIFNLSIRNKNLKLTPNRYKEAVRLRDEGLSYENIAKRMGLSSMTIYRGLNRQTISLETQLAE